MARFDAFDLRYAFDLEFEVARAHLDEALGDLPWALVDRFGEPAWEADDGQVDVSLDPWERAYTASGGSASAEFTEDPDELGARLDRLARAARHLARVPGLRRLSMSRIGPQVFWLPFQRFETAAGIRTLHGNDLITTLGEPNSAAQAGWEVLGHALEGPILARGLDRATIEDWLDQAVEMQWALARRSRPGLTTYAVEWDPDPEDLPWARRGPATLTQIEAETWRAHPSWPMQGWELMELGRRVHEGERVRVIFPSVGRRMVDETPCMDLGIDIVTETGSS